MRAFVEAAPGGSAGEVGARLLWQIRLGLLAGEAPSSNSTAAARHSEAAPGPAFSWRRLSTAILLGRLWMITCLLAFRGVPEGYSFHCSFRFFFASVFFLAFLGGWVTPGRWSGCAE